MIKYETEENKYYYNDKDIDDIIDNIKSINFYDKDNLTRENISGVVDSVNDFLSNMDVKEEKVIKERKVTEEEAREYFGEKIINDFDNLINRLNKEETILAIHGTNVDNCPNICDEGLKYRAPSLLSTAIPLDLGYDQENMTFDNYKRLLNWDHKEYKGLVLLAIPYECYYKEGLWGKIDNDNIYDSSKYKINPDFIVGYLDVDNKQIVLNDKHNREHNYDNLEKDMDIFVEKKDMNNDLFVEMYNDARKNIDNSIDNSIEDYELSDSEIIKRIPDTMEVLVGNLNSIKHGVMEEEKYHYFLDQLKNLNDVERVIPLLKTNAEVENEKSELNSMFAETVDSATFNDGYEFDFGFDDDIDWNDSKDKSSKNK